MLTNNVERILVLGVAKFQSLLLQLLQFRNFRFRTLNRYYYIRVFQLTELNKHIDV